MRALVETTAPAAAILVCCLVAPLLIGGLGALAGGAVLCVGLALALGSMIWNAADCCR